jgi:hypothetical protein
VAANNAHSTSAGTALVVTPPGVLGNDTDVENDPLTAVLDDNVDNGTLTLNSNGSLSYTPNAFFVGTDSFTYHANDGTVGSNIATVTIAVSYQFGGFLRPIDNLPTLNLAKAGSSIPIKFSLGGYKGMNILATGSPASKVAPCDAAAATDAVEETSTAGNSSLSYDATADQYTYVWKTVKTWTGCRQLQMKLADGNTYAANFKLK